MFFLLSKLLYFLVNPLVWIFAILISCICVKNKKIQSKLYGLLLIMFYMLSNNALVNIILQKWEISSKSTDSITTAYTYAIVLGGIGVKDENTGKFTYDRTIDRIIQPIKLYKAEKISKIIITGGSGNLYNQADKEAPWIKEFCIKLGVDSTDIIVESKSKNTYENALFTKRIITSSNEKVLLVTSGIHMRRSMAVFKKVGYNFDYLATDPLWCHRLYIDDYLMPKASALVKWTSLSKEIIGYVVYKVVGYI